MLFERVGHPCCVVGVVSAETIARAAPDPMIIFALEAAQIQPWELLTLPSSCLHQSMNAHAVVAVPQIAGLRARSVPSAMIAIAWRSMSTLLI
jgi:hypothetical protein